MHLLANQFGEECMEDKLDVHVMLSQKDSISHNDNKNEEDFVFIYILHVYIILNNYQINNMPNYQEATMFATYNVDFCVYTFADLHVHVNALSLLAKRHIGRGMGDQH